MALIAEIRNKITEDLFEFSRHALDRSIIRHIIIDEIREAVAQAEIIEDYPDDKYRPSCLILGFTIAKRPLQYSYELSITSPSQNYYAI